MRVLLAPIDIAGQARMTAFELNKRGHHARFFDGATNYLGYEHEKGQEFALKELEDVRLAEYDVFDIFFAAFKPVNGTLPNKLRVVHHFCGTDVRQLDVAKKHNRFAVVKGKDNSKAIRAHLAELAATSEHCTIMDEELRPHVEPFFEYVHIVPRMVDLDKFNPIYNGHKKLTVVHASTHAEVKGTADIVKAVRNLKNNRVFDFWLVAGMRHDKAMELYKKADIVICQLNLDSYGVFAIEAMALGKLVITRLSDKMRETYPEDPPLVSADPDNIRDVLADVLKWSPEKRAEIGHKGRGYVQNWHAPSVVAPKIISVYEQL